MASGNSSDKSAQFSNQKYIPKSPKKDVKAEKDDKPEESQNYGDVALEVDKDGHCYFEEFKSIEAKKAQKEMEFEKALSSARHKALLDAYGYKDFCDSSFKELAQIYLDKRFKQTKKKEKERYKLNGLLEYLEKEQITMLLDYNQLREDKIQIHLRRLIDYLKKPTSNKRERKSSTIYSYFNEIKQFLIFLGKKFPAVLGHLVEIEYPKVERKDDISVNLKELVSDFQRLKENLNYQIEQMFSINAEPKPGDEDRITLAAFLGVLVYQGGLKLGELLNIKISDVDVQAMKISFERRKKKHTITLHRTTRIVLEKYNQWKKDNGMIISNQDRLFHIDEKELRKMMRRLCNAANTKHNLTTEKLRKAVYKKACGWFGGDTKRVKDFMNCSWTTIARLGNHDTRKTTDPVLRVPNDAFIDPANII